MTVPHIDYTIIAPVLVLAAAAVLVLLFDLMVDKPPRIMFYAIGIVGCAGAFATMLPLYGRTATTLEGAFATDKFSWPFDVIVLVALVAAFLLSSARRAEDGDSPASYAALLIASAIGAFVMAGATTLLGVFLGIEQLSLALYVLAGTGFPRQSSQEAALKYVLLGSLASGFLIYGSALLYGAAGSIAIADLAKAAAAGSPLFVTGFALFLAGLAFKLALAPFHVWAPDVYEGSPLAVTAFMSVAVKAASFAVLARVIFGALPHGSTALVALWVIAIASMLVGNLGAIRQTNLKRLLAYSSIAQAGYIVIGFIGGAGAGLGAVVFYLAAYAFMGLGSFAVLALVGDGAEAATDLDAYRSLYFRRPWTAAVMSLFLLSLAGIPPTAGFIGKVLLLGQAVGAGAWGIAMAVALIVGTAVSFYVYFKVIWQMFVPVEGVQPATSASSVPAWVAIGAGAIGVLVLGVAPQLLLR